MDSRVHQIRHRSSTRTTRNPRPTAQTSEVDAVLKRLATFEGRSSDASAVTLQSIHNDLKRLSTLLQHGPEQATKQDAFRRSHGFQAVIAVLRFVASSAEETPTSTRDIDLVSQVLCAALLALLTAFEEHQGNRRYFAKRVGSGGWNVLRGILISTYRMLLDTSEDAKSLIKVTCQLLNTSFRLLLGDERHTCILDPADFQGAQQQPAELQAKVRDTAEDVTENDTQHDTVHDNDHNDQKRVGKSPVECSQRNVQDADAVPIILGICYEIAKSNDPKILSICTTTIHTILQIADLSIRNKARIHGSGVLSSLLIEVTNESLPSEIRASLQTLCLALLSFGVNRLDDAAALFQKASGNESAMRLLHTALEIPKEPACLHFDLFQHGYSSIELPGMPRAFPPSAGYSFTAWFRVDDFDAKYHTTLFGAFDPSQTCFVLLYLEKDTRQLILQTSITAERPSVRFRSPAFALGKWYHIALIHRPSKSANASLAALFVNGEYVDKRQCVYPDLPPVVHRGQNGAMPSNQDATRRQPVQVFFGTPQNLTSKVDESPIGSKWSLANARIYDALLSDEVIAVYQRLGPHYNANFQDCMGPMLTYRASAELNHYNDLLHPEKADKSEIVTATQQRGSDIMGESRILVSISPLAVVTMHGLIAGSVDILSGLSPVAMQNFQSLTRTGNSILINAARPAINDALTRTYGAAMLTGDPVVIIPQSLDDASWRVGGCLAINMRILEMAITDGAILQAVDILFMTIRENWRTSEVMEKEEGFGILAILLREKLGFGPAVPAVGNASAIPRRTGDERNSLAVKLMEKILKFVGYDHMKPEDSMLINPMAYRVLMIDFDTWRTLSVDTQKLYYQQFIHFIQRNRFQSFNTKRLMKMRIVRRFLDALKVDSISSEALPDLLDALKALTLCNTTHTNHRDIATFIAYALQHDRSASGPRVSTPKGVHRASISGRASPFLRAGSPFNGGLDIKKISKVAQAELGANVLRMYTDILCDSDNIIHLKRFAKQVPSRWMLHLIAESDQRIVTCALAILAQSLATLGKDFKTRFTDKTPGFTSLKCRLRNFWTVPDVWYYCFSILFGYNAGKLPAERELNVYNLIDIFVQDKTLVIENPEILPSLTNVLEAALRSTVRESKQSEETFNSQANIPKTIVQFLAEVHGRSQAFRDFAVTSHYVQELLFVLFPVIASSDRLSAASELASDSSGLNFQGNDVVIRPHSNSLGERPAIVRSGSSRTLPEPVRSNRVQAPRRTSSFVLVSPTNTSDPHVSARFNQVMSPKKAPVKMSIGNDIVESLLEAVVAVFTDQVCMRKDFAGFGLFLKVPPGFQEHQAYFESYVLLHTMYHLWSHMQLNQGLLVEPRVLTNLARYTLHMAEAVFEGWFIDGAQPLLEFTGKVLDYLQQPDIARVKSVRLCSQAITTIRSVFLRVTLLRLSELDETEDDTESFNFLHKLNYWQTILFSPENQDLPFIRLICYLLYMKLVSPSHRVRTAAAMLFRMLLVQKPTEAATVLISSGDSSHLHLSTGLMKLTTHDDEELLQWISDRRDTLDRFFLEILSRPWEDFVNGENQKTEESAKNRLAKRKDRLKQWQTEETELDTIINRFETSTRHWRSNIYSQERLKYQRAVQDQQENLSHLQGIIARMEDFLRQPCGLFPDTRAPKWRLDQTEARNRMRMRLLRDPVQNQEVYQSKRKASEGFDKLTINTKINAPSISDTVMSPTPTSVRFPEDATNDIGSQIDRSSPNAPLLEGDFEMVDDPREDEEGWEDKNRKVMRSLQHGEKVHQIYNVSTIIALEGCEGLLIVGKNCLYLQDHLFQRSDGEIVGVHQAPAEERDPYVQMIAGKEVRTQKPQRRFTEQSAKHWTWAELLSISKRRFLFRDVALEVFFTDGRSFLLTFLNPEIRNAVYAQISSRAPQVHSSSASLAAEDAWRLDSLRTPDEAPQTFGSKFASVFNNSTTNSATRKWQRGEISNFQYLMLVNTMAGRTFNDLTQYPVFPWVLADYTSTTLDLSDPRTFRAFSKPMGSQHPARESDFRERYRVFAEMGDGPAFHYGTHYSSAMIVTSFLIRLPPFVQSYLLLQGGTFDHADRLFDSIERTWLSASKDNMTDVRELTPEFFYLPSFLTNLNDYDFGVKQGSGTPINNVELPPWAHGDPHLFIARHREALESPYVTAHLHEWIDLVFGYKQRGEAALEATNVFHHLSYQGNANLDAIDDEIDRVATIGIIHGFGQTPHQVFTRAHPRSEAERYKPARLDSIVETLVKLPEPKFESGERVSTLLYSATQDRLRCSPPGKLEMPPSCKRFLQWGFADHSLRFFSSDSKRLLGLYEQFHIGPITTALFADARTLVTAGADCTIGVWAVGTGGDGVELTSRTYLFGHRTPVEKLAASRACSTLVSADEGGRVLVWDLNRYECVRVLRDPGAGEGDKGKVTAMQVSNTTGHILLCCGAWVALYTLNGELLVRQRVCEDEDATLCCAFYEGLKNEWVERELVFTGHGRGVVNIWALVNLTDGAWHLQLVKRLSHADPRLEGAEESAAAITAVLPMPLCVFTGDEEGRVWEWNCVQRGTGRR